MSIRERKLNLVESLLRLENEESISFLEAYLKVKHGPMTKEELSKRAINSSQEILEWKVIEQDELEKESEKW